jgi:CBS domain-containing protein
MEEAQDWDSGQQTVAEVMTTDLFTVRPDDLVDLAASVMNWRHIRHVPVEDDEGHLVGLISHRDLLRLLTQGWLARTRQPITVQEIMKRELVTIAPENSILEALSLMRLCQVGCLPVVENERLVGIVTAYDFLSLAAEIIEGQWRRTNVPADVPGRG